MKVVVNRLHKTAASVTGTVEVNNRLKYYSMEPASAIPAGTYQLVRYYSVKHKAFVPLVKDVPGHSGIEIHVGNYPADTEGCCLFGAGYLQKDFISSSKIAIDEFYSLFFAAVARNEKCTITYLNNF